ncbi:MAG TPA: hypothetical protein VF100_03645, partial [Thermoanaerobaculia bacterium]
MLTKPPFPLGSGPARSAAVACALALAGLGGAVAAQPLLSPPLFLGNGPRACSPREPALAAVPGGGFLAVWDDGGAVRQRFDRHGAAIEAGATIAGGASDVGSVEASAVAVSPDGAFAVAWLDRQSGVVEALVFGDGPLRLLELGSVDLQAPAAPPPPFHIGLAAGRDGFFAVWQGGPPNAALFDGESGVRVRTQLQPSGVGIGSGTLFQPAVAYDAVGDGFVAAWVDPGSLILPTPPIFSIHARRFDAAGVARGAPIWAGWSYIPPSTFAPAVLPAADGGFTVVWSGAIASLRSRPFTPVGVLARRFGADGAPLGHEQVIAELPAVAPVAAAADAAGNLVALWAIDPLGPEEPVELRARTFDPGLAPTSDVILLDGGVQGAPLDPAVAVSGPGEATAMWWEEGFVFPGLALPCTESEGLRARRLSLGGETDLLLRDGRFRLEVTWDDPFNGGSGVGRPLPESEQSGSFWFFEEANRELLVKVLDGRLINGHWWVFYGSLTNVGFTLTVADQASGETRTYENPPMTFASRGD